MSGTMDIVIAGGVESMSRVPMNMPSSLPRQNDLGFYMSPVLQARYPAVEFSQFVGAEMIAGQYGLDREQLDAYALSSQQRAAAATRAGHFDAEIVALPARLADGSTSGAMASIDEGIRFDATAQSIGAVKLLERQRHHQRRQCKPDLRRRLRA